MRCVMVPTAIVELVGVMFPIVLFIFAVVAAIIHRATQQVTRWSKTAELLLGYLIFLSIGVSSLIAALSHLILGPVVADAIGWLEKSPFQFEVAMANVSYAVLGLIAFWQKNRFREATAIGWSLFVLGCFVGHMIQAATGNTTPLNFGIFVWFNDLLLPLTILSLAIYTMTRQAKPTPSFFSKLFDLAKKK